MKDGKCFEEGTYEELTTNDVNLASLIGEYMEIEDPDQIDDIELISDIRLESVDELQEPPLDVVVVSDSKNGANLEYSPTDANEATIHRLAELNSHTNVNINEQTISKMIERNNLTVLGGAGKTRMMGAQVNRELNVTAKAVERNQLTIHSLNERDAMTSIHIYYIFFDLLFFN